MTRIKYGLAEPYLWVHPNGTYYACWRQDNKNRRKSLRTQDEAKAKRRFRNFKRDLLAGRLTYIETGVKKRLYEFADELIAHNGDKFDLRFIRSRCLYHGVLMFPNYRTLDTLKKSRGGFLFASNKLDYLGKHFGVGGKTKHRGREMWEDVIEGDPETSKKALTEMIEYCERDVIMLEDVYFIMSPFITHNNNFAVLTGGDKWDCPECGSDNVQMHHTYTTAMGIIRREMKCNNCKKQYKISNKNYMGMLEHMMK